MKSSSEPLSEEEQVSPTSPNRRLTQVRNYFTEEDPTMKLSQQGVNYDDLSVLGPN